MTTLKRGVANHNQVVQSDNYVNADTNKKNDYNNAYNHANDIINGNAQHPVITPSDVNNALSNVTSKEQALNGNTKLNAAKQEANTALGHLNNLNNAQRQNLQSQINNAYQIDAVNTIKQNATNLNSAMGNLRQAVADKEQVKRTEDYADADTPKQNAYNNAVSSAETIINQTANPTMSVDDVNRATSAVTTNKNALNGDEKLAQSKTDASSAIDALPHLNNAQKADVKSKINAASNIAGVNAVKQQGTDLNTAMGNLQGAINDEQATLNSQNYQDATPSKKTAYTNAVQAAKDILNQARGANKTKDQVNEAMNQVNSAKNNLDGTRLLDQAKQTAKQQLNNMTHLTTAQKTNLTNQINSGTTVAGVQTVQSNANTLDQAMNTLRQSIANKDATKASEDYVDANNDKQTAFNNAVAVAETIINANSNPEMNPSTITQKAEQVNSSKNALNGDENLATAKQNAKTYLNTLTSITDAQKNNLISQITNATRVSGVDTVKQNAQHLDQAMASLQNGINNESQMKSSEKYRDADTNKQQEYDNAITAAKAILNKSTGPNTAQNAVEAALQRVNSTKTALNGDAKLNEAKTTAKQTLGTLTHINNAQRTPLDNEITQATNIDGVNTVKVKAQQLDSAMGQLETSIRDKDTTLQSQNYQDADDAKRTAYSQAVNAAATILNKTAGGNTSKADVERAMQAVTQANTALNGIQNLNRAKQDANTAITNASDLNTKQKEALKAQVTSAGRVSAANGVEHTATELNTAMTALKHAIADKTEIKASGNYVNADANKRQAYDEKVTAAENIVSGTPTPTLTPSDVTNAATQVTNAKTQLNGNHNLEVAKQNANTAIDGLTSLNGPQKAKLKEQVGQATTLPNVQTVRDNAQTLNTAMKGLRDSIANESTIKAAQNYTDASQSKQTDYNNAVSAAKAIIGQTSSPTKNAQDINQAKEQVTAKQQALNGQENLRTAQTNAKQHLNGLSDLTDAQKDASKRQIEGATHVNEVTQAQNNADALNTAMTNLKNGIQDQNTIKQGVNFTDADEAKRNAYTNAVTQAEQILNKAQGPNTPKDGVETALQNVQRAKNELNGNQNVANAKTNAKNALNNLTSINNAQKEALKSQIDSATTVAGVNQVSTTASELNTAMSNLQRGINDETATKAAQKYTDADRDKQTAYNDAVTAAKTLLDKTAGTNENKAAVEQALQRVNTAKTALNGDARLNEAKNTAKQQLATMSHLTDAQKANLTSQIESGTTVAGVQGIHANAGTLNQAMNQLRQSIASKDATKSSEDYQDANTDSQNAYNRAVSDAEGIISATNNPEMNPDTINQKASQVNSAKSTLNGDEKLAAAKQSAKLDIGRLSDLNNAQQTAANAEVDQAPNIAAVTAAKNKATSLNTAMGHLKQALAEKDNTKRSVNYTDADQPKQQAYDTAVSQVEAITNPNGSNANETQVQAALNQLNQAKHDLNGDNKVAQAKEAAKRALASYSNLNNAQSTSATSQIDNATTVAEVTTAQNTANELNTAMGQLQNGINDQNTVKQQVNFKDADQGKKDDYTTAVTNAQGILDKANGQNMTKAQVESALNQVTTAKNALNGDANVRQAKSDAKANLGTLIHLNHAQKQALKGQIDQSPEIATVTQVKQTATSLDQAMNQLSQAINDKTQTLADGNYLNADSDKQNAYKQAVAKAEALLNKQSGTNELQAQVESITNEVNTAKQALNGNDNLANAKQQAKQQLANLTHLNDAQKQSFESQITQAPLVTDVTTINQKAQALDHAMELLRNSIADNQATLASEDYHDATAQRQNDYNQAVTAAKNIINQTTSPTMNPDEVNSATTEVNNTKVALDGDENLATAKQQANNRLAQLDHLNNAQKQQLQSQITQSSDIATVNGHKQTAEVLNTAMGNLINAIANHQEVEQRGNYVNADTDKQTAYTTAVNEAEAMINKQTGQNANQTEVEQAITKVQTTLQALNGDHNLQVAKANATQAIESLTSLNDPQKTALKDQVTAATLVTAVHQIEQNANTLNQAMHGLRESIKDNAATKANSVYINEDQPEQQRYDQAVQAAKDIINEQTATLDNNAINQAASTVNTSKAALHGDVKLQNDKNHAKQTVNQLEHLNNAQKHMEDTLIDSETTRTAVNHDLTEAQALNQLMDALQQSIADKDATHASSAYVNAEPNKKQAYDEAIQNAESIIAGVNNPTINKGNVSSATQAVNTTKNALDGVERLAQDKQTAGNSLNHLDQLTPAQQQALENQINQSPTREKVAEIIAQAQALNEAMNALKESIQDQPQTETSSKFINEDQAQKDAYNQAVQHAKDLINKTTDPTLAKSLIDQATQAVTDAKNNLHGDQKLADDKQHANESLNNLSNLNAPQRQALENQINQAATRDEVAQKLAEAQALNQAMEALRNSIQDQQQTEAGSKFINEDKPQKDAYQEAVQNAKDLINQTSNPTLDKAQIEQLTQAVNQVKDNLHGDQKLADDKQHAVTDLNQLNGLNGPQRQALESQINNAATRGEVA